MQRKVTVCVFEIGAWTRYLMYLNRMLSLFAENTINQTYAHFLK